MSVSIKKRFLLESSLFVILLSGAAGLVYVLDIQSQDYISQNQTLEVEIAKVTTERNALQTKYDNVRNNMSVYQEALAKNPAGVQFPSRQYIQDKFNQYQNRFSLANLRLTMTPRKEATESKLKKDSKIVAYTDVTVTFETLIDDSAYSLLAAIEKEFNGIVKVTSFKVTRTVPYSDKVIEGILRTGTHPLFKTEMQMTWYGIVENEKSAAKVPNAP